MCVSLFFFLPFFSLAFALPFSLSFFFMMQTLAAVINYIYALRHNYSYTYIHLDMRAPAKTDQYDQGKWNTCAHPLFGARAAPWCKLLGVRTYVSAVPERALQCALTSMSPSLHFSPPHPTAPHLTHSHLAFSLPSPTPPPPPLPPPPNTP